MLWDDFKSKDHLECNAPIPPSTRVLTLHLFLNAKHWNISEIRSVDFITHNSDLWLVCFKEGKRRLQICSTRILD